MTQETKVQNIKDPQISKFSLFRGNIRNVTNAENVTLQVIFDLITSLQFVAKTKTLRVIKGKKNKDEFKIDNFDYVTFNGVFSRRDENSLLLPSQLFIVDIDHLGDRLKAVRQRLISDKVMCPQLIFISPSGDGLKIIVRIDFSVVDPSVQTNRMGNIWQAVNTYFGKVYADLITPNEKNHFIDGAGKDISRACFLCYDETAWLNINEDNILGQKFIEEMPPIEVAGKKKAAYKKNESYVPLKVSPQTTLQDLAGRHLMDKENHTPELVSFIGAALAIGTPINHTLEFITNHVNISKESSKSDPEKLSMLLEDLYSRYDTNSDGIKYLTPLSFGYKILLFKYVKDIKQYVVSSLFWDEVRNVLHVAGFAKRKVGKGFLYIQKKGCVINEVSPEIMRDYLTSYVTSIEESICFTYQDNQYQIPPVAIRETYLKNSNNIFNAVWLEHLQIHDEPILKDTESEMYFFFKNDLVTVSKEGLKTESWIDKKGVCIWEDQIIQHDFNYVEDKSESHFFKFINNVTNQDRARFLTMATGIGYLLHHHFRESEGQAVVFYDETITDTRTPMGGSGKGLIVNAIKQVRKVSKVDGKHLDGSNRFRWEQITPSTQLAWLDDVKPDFDFTILHSNLTDGWTIERKHLSQFLIEPKNSPKTVICSNSIIKGGGTTNKRRQFIIELSDFYSRQIIKGDEKPIEKTHGCLFFNNQEWNANEWDMFFSVMLEFALHYLDHGLVQYDGINVELNRFRQSTTEDFAAWVECQGFCAGHARYDTKKYFGNFISTYYKDERGNRDPHTIGQRTFTGNLKSYALYKGWGFEVNQSNGISYFTFKTSI